MRQVEGEKYSCHASSILDVNDVTNQMEVLSVNRKQVRPYLFRYF